MIISIYPITTVVYEIRQYYTNIHTISFTLKQEEQRPRIYDYTKRTIRCVWLWRRRDYIYHRTQKTTFRWVRDAKGVNALNLIEQKWINQKKASWKQFDDIFFSSCCRSDSVGNCWYSSCGSTKMTHHQNVNDLCVCVCMRNYFVPLCVQTHHTRIICVWIPTNATIAICIYTYVYRVLHFNHNRLTTIQSQTRSSSFFSHIHRVVNDDPNTESSSYLNT